MEMLWHGTLSFELVHIPIKLYKAVRTRRVEFRLLHEADLAPIQYLKVCSAEQEPVADEEIVRGVRVDDEWVTVTDDELARLAPTLTRTITIRDFVDLREIDPVFYRKPYFLAPDEGGEDAYAMVREALRRSGKVGVAEFVLVHREHLAVVRPGEASLMLETLHFPEELIDERELELPAGTRLREGEIRMATELIRNLSQRFDATRYRNDYRAQVVELLRGKAEGRLPPRLEPTPAPAPTPVADLTRRLKESLERTGGRAA
ncbi:MAG TPA: Ku protein [Longimicrobiales bacterium]